MTRPGQHCSACSPGVFTGNAEERDEARERISEFRVVEKSAPAEADEMSLGDAAVGETLLVRHVGGERAFRRRVMELGLLPGTAVMVVGIAPLGDPIKLAVRGCELSIRRHEARAIRVSATRASRLAMNKVSTPVGAR
ncbi:MAG TPA: FeoA family protein [Polyangiaceae bacterium]